MQTKIESTKGYKIVVDWFNAKGLQPFSFQKETWQHIIKGKSGLVNAPTGCGKTFSVFLGAVIDFINYHPDNYRSKKKNGIQILWITPLRSLAKDIGRAMEEVIDELGMNWKAGIRNGDTTSAERKKQLLNSPEVLVITPESLHLLLAQKGYSEFFSTLKIIAVDEWHELLGSKRGVQVELAVSRILNAQNASIHQNYQRLTVWGISATIGNLEQAKKVLLTPLDKLSEEKELFSVIVKADMHKQVDVESILPDEIEKFPWSGHLGIKLADKAISIINSSKTTLIFINTRGMSEIWYQTLLNKAPELAGLIALHHGSIEQEIRSWVEENLHSGKLRAVVCTSSLDLGVDFRPVETVIQVGSPKGVARFLQRAGRSGHSPGSVSKIYFLPTHSLELVEAAALKTAIKENFIENREPLLLCFDVLIQYLCTLAISEGFDADKIFEEIKSTHCFREMSKDEWQNILAHITLGGLALRQYEEFKKVEKIDGSYKIQNRKVVMRHRLHIGTIVSEAMMKVKFVQGGYVGVIEEWFVSRLEPGEVFTLAGSQLELVAIKEMTALVKKSKAKKSIVPSWQGGRMPLSAKLGKKLRQTFDHAFENQNKKREIELEILQPLFDLQKKLSHVPKENELLIEQIETKDGYHLFVYPFEGRLVHEAIAAVLAYRISKIEPITFSFAMNDYGFELLSDKPIPVDDGNVYELFSTKNLLVDIQRSVNATEMAKRKFRDIAVIGGLVFQGYPGEQKKAKHLQTSASLLFNVFSEFEPNNLLLRQSYNEVLMQQMEEVRLRSMLERIQQSEIVITFPQQLTPFCFPIKVDSMREDLSSEKLEERVKRMQQQLEIEK
jgi:ATP-dependent Lhr-like helicase